MSFVCPQRTPSPIQRWEIFTITSSRDSLHYNTRVPHVQCVYMVSHMCANNLFYTDTLSNLITHTLSVSQIHSDRQDTHTHTNKHRHTHKHSLSLTHTQNKPHMFSLSLCHTKTHTHTRAHTHTHTYKDAHRHTLTPP